jgi:hypothetical protein
MKHISIFVFLSVWTAQLQSQHQEPVGGLYPSTLTIFRDEVAGGISAGPFGTKLSIDTSTKKTGKASWRWEVKGSDGVHILWGGWGKDTTVFWVHDNSHVSFWVRPGNDRVKINVLLGYMDGRYEVLRSAVVGRAGTWRYMDLLVPSEAVGRPLNDLKIITHENRGGRTTLHFDDMKISHVRLYAGKGTPQSISGVFADQVGYDTYGIKTFSAEKYESYEIIRVGDGKKVYKGKDSRAVSSHVINDRAAYHRTAQASVREVAEVIRTR